MVYRQSPHISQRSMEILPLLCVVSAAFTGLTIGAGVLPDSLIAAVGEPVMFTTKLTPADAPLISIIWNFGENNIITSHAGGNTSLPEYEHRITLFISTGSLELRNVALKDSGEYSVSIVPSAGPGKSGSTTLNVYERVSNVVAIASNTDLVEFNSSVRLSCSASGSPVSYLWLNDSSEVTASDRVQLTDGGSNLTIVNVTRYDKGPFTCHVLNPVSNGTSDPLRLNINYGPENIKVAISPSQEYFEEGSNITLSCSADSSPAPVFYWFMNGDKMSDTGSELKLLNMSQSGNYSCQAFNHKTMRYETSQSVVSVLERITDPSVTPSTNLTVAGDSANLTCDAAGSVFTRTWTKDSLNLTNAENIQFYDNNRVLSFQPLKKTDSGEYSCVISNPVSNAAATFIVVVNYGPENVQISGSRQMHLEQTLTLNCSAESTPTAGFTWTLNGNKIHNSSVFTKQNIQLSDSGNYSCEALNDITGRTSSASHQLTVTDIPPPISPCQAGCIAGIVIACLILCGAAATGGYCIYTKKKQVKKTGSNNGVDNTAYTENQDLNYADIRFVQNKDRGTVQLGLQTESSEYAQVRVNRGRPATPPSYDVHLQRSQRADPDANGTHWK